MSIVIKTNPREFPRLVQSRLRSAPRAVEKGMRRGAMRGRTIVSRKTPKDTGQLKASWRVHRFPEIVLANDAPHAGIVEMGARPHPVNKAGLMAIYRWVYRHRSSFGIRAKKRNKKVRKTSSSGRGLDPNIMSIANAIAWKIRKHGQRPTYFVRQSLPAMQAAMVQEVVKAVEKHSRDRRRQLYGPGF